jgi:hypothetical protein
MVNIITKGLFAEPYKSLSVGITTFGKFQGMKLLVEDEVYIGVCEPQPVSDEVGSLHVFGLIVEEDVIPIPGIGTDRQPDKIDVGEYLPDKIVVTKTLPTLKTLPLPGNL